MHETLWCKVRNRVGLVRFTLRNWIKYGRSS